MPQSCRPRRDPLRRIAAAVRQTAGKISQPQLSPEVRVHHREQAGDNAPGPSRLDMQIRGIYNSSTSAFTLPDDTKYPVTAEERECELKNENIRLEQEVTYYKSVVHRVLIPLILALGPLADNLRQSLRQPEAAFSGGGEPDPYLATGRRPERRELCKYLEHQRADRMMGHIEDDEPLHRHPSLADLRHIQGNGSSAPSTKDRVIELTKANGRMRSEIAKYRPLVLETMEEMLFGIEECARRLLCAGETAREIVRQSAESWPPSMNRHVLSNANVYRGHANGGSCFGQDNPRGCLRGHLPTDSTAPRGQAAHVRFAGADRPCRSTDNYATGGGQTVESIRQEHEYVSELIGCTSLHLVPQAWYVLGKLDRVIDKSCKDLERAGNDQPPRLATHLATGCFPTTFSPDHICQAS
ncbi:uncharacterized protein F5Z01DRAFT_640082 [Emericellopsis atlantica]|uniref:Uncharacterized protein n=1 Tax=Emericellopsis atlantica TaxID=2614577 RepID=A0A9P7ZEU2_9HYPO|nr:uncharacterized protein F5Z01DRAFT_640082 [Emericellopsis atlantica]KAG9250675.1 hypothetical protein F5Z01DRAFT_640082 [Emericellopsis atlantica]